jgi:TonB family protein
MQLTWHYLVLAIFLSPTSIVAASAKQPDTPEPPSTEVKSKAVQIEGSISDEDYPPEASSKGETGTVVIKFVISTNGRVPVCEIMQSSSSELLDETTCEIVKERFKYEPARAHNGKAIPEIKSQRITWRIPNGPERLERMTPFEENYELVVSSDGAVKDCKVLKSVTSPSLPQTSEAFCTAIKANIRYQSFQGTKDRRLTYRSALEVTDVP